LFLIRAIEAKIFKLINSAMPPFFRKIHASIRRKPHKTF
jgi:hypothetical protein